MVLIGTGWFQVVPTGSDQIPTNYKRFRLESNWFRLESGQNRLEPTGSDRYLWGTAKYCFHRLPHAVKSVPKYHGNGCRSAGKRDKRIPRSVLGSLICAGQRAWLQPGGCALMGCRCPISDGQGWAKAQLGRTGTRLHQENAL